jgi:hypothetical protein
MVTHRDGVTPVAIDQNLYSNQWVTLGEFCFSAGTGGWVELTDTTGEVVASRSIAFDAVRWTCVGNCTPNAGTPTATATVTTVPQPTATPTATATTPACPQYIGNPGFESVGSWFMQGLRSGRYSNATSFSGSWSGLMGILPDESDLEAHSSIYQAITIPADATSASLHFWYKPFAQSPHLNDANLYDWSGFKPGEDVIRRQDVQQDMEMQVSGAAKESWASQDWQYALIRYGPYGQSWAYVLATNSNASVWLDKSFDLMPWRGQQIWVHFEVRNDGGGFRTWMYVDDVTVNICR